MGVQWLTVIYSLLTCVGGGMLAFIGVSELAGLAPKARKAAAIAAALLLLAGVCVFVFSLPKATAVFAVATNAVKGSAKSLEFVCAIASLAAAIVYTVVAFRSEDEESTAAKVVGIVGALLGIAMGIFAGASAAVGRPWAGIALPVSYLGAGLAMGGTLFATLGAVLTEEEADLGKVAPLFLVGGVVQAVGFVFLGAMSGFAMDALVYWLGAVAIGTVVPLVCLALAPKVRALVFAAFVCSTVGAVCIRLAVYAMGTASLGLIATASSRVAL